MKPDQAVLFDRVLSECGYSRASAEDAGLMGWGYGELRGPSGELKLFVPFVNLITDVGDSYYGNRNYPILGGTTAVTAITAASPAVVSATAHGLSVGDKVVLAGITPAGYNGSWVITAVTANTFSINVGTAQAVGTAFGTCQGVASPVASGMKLGTGSTAVAKSGAGAALVTYGTGVTANKAFDATYPQLSNLGAGLGVYTVYKTTWNAGQATVTGLTEAVIVNENVFADATTAAAFTISRTILSPTVNKGALDTFALTWNHKFLGV